jgi:hypothetical protein
MVVPVVSEYTFGNYLLRVEGGVIEQFSRQIGLSYRLPVTWAAAEFENRKDDVVRVSIGVAADPTASFFSSIARTNTYVFTFEIPSGEEPRLRGFLSGAARDAGRVA